MQKRLFFSLLSLAGLLMAAPVQAETYKWKDANGRTHFSDQPPPSGNVIVTPQKAPKTQHGTPLKNLTNESPQIKAEQKRLSEEEKLLEQARRDLQPGSGKTIEQVEKEIQEKTKTKVQQEQQASKKKLDDARQAREKAESEKKAQAEAKSKNERKEYCNELKLNLEQIKPGERVSQYNPKTKEKEYLDDAAILAKQKELQAKQQAYCQN